MARSSLELFNTIAPDFELSDEEGRVRKLSEMLKKSSVMLAFYPGDFRMVCTKQLCAYQDNYDFFQSMNVEIVGISHNTPEEHRKFKQTYRFSFPLLSDPKRETIKNYGLISLLMLGGTARAVFLVGRSGKVLYRYIEPTALTRRKPTELKEALEALHSQKLL